MTIRHESVNFLRNIPASIDGTFERVFRDIKIRKTMRHKPKKARDDFDPGKSTCHHLLGTFESCGC